MSAPTLTEPLDVARFWSKVDVRRGGECWMWEKSRSTAGYGQFMVRTGEIMRAHRLAWELVNGRAVPEGASVLHSCDNRLCCNPAHLRLGTQAENVADMHARGRANQSRHRPGELAPNRKLSQAGVDEIRQQVAEGASQSSVARQYGIGKAQVSRIVNGLRWPMREGK